MLAQIQRDSQQLRFGSCVQYNPQDPGSRVASDSQQTLPVDEKRLTQSSQKSETLIFLISDKKVQLKSCFMYINVD